ncbi:acyl-CoA dehydrogenase family protein [Amycolatopsis taiwanensis]|uniref:acyl-CoA dehydrogenase family protein n=1 Tax=Amycolatopsis taiwanensis TaxID=342230 RepID=UPI000485BD08|nr:acyl-CoA dehydrogenase family protein [Amycolatopsis taiwanensis]
MRFELDDDLRAARDLAERIFADQASVERVKAAEAAGGFDRKLWQVLAEAGALGIPLPESAGGSGMGLLGLVTLLEQQGRRVAGVPLWPALTAASAVARFGGSAQVERLLPAFVDGSTILTAAIEGTVGRPVAARAVPDGDGLRLHGDLGPVPAAAVADAVVVAAGLESGEITVVVLPKSREGVVVTEVEVTSRESYANVTLDGARVSTTDVLSGDGREILAYLRRCARIALSSVQIGVCGEALRMTAAYTSERIQFGRPLSTNQAVAMRAADAYLDVEQIRLTTQRAAWLADAGRERESEAAALVAKWWASRAGLRVVHATQHLHGGIGADVDYPIHRYFLWGRQIAFSLGSAEATAAELGDVLETLDAETMIGAAS